MGTREILTLQFGHYANFVGTHWWNLQERAFEYSETTLSEINHDVLYREGLTSRSEVTFTPRLLLVDLKGSLKSLPEKGDLYDPLPHPSKVEVEWDESVDIKASTSEQKNEFQTDLEDPEESKRVLSKNYKLEEEVNVWSDFLYAKFHPRTVNVLREYQHCNENTPFDAYPLGVSLWKTQQFEEDFSDKIRNYIEECDHFQSVGAMETFDQHHEFYNISKIRVNSPKANFPLMRCGVLLPNDWLESCIMDEITNMSDIDM